MLILKVPLAVTRPNSTFCQQHKTVRGEWNSKTLTIWGHLHLHRHCPVAFWDMHCRHGPDLIKSSSAPVTLSETHEWVMARRGPGNQIALSKSSLYNPQRAQKSRYRSAKTSLRKLRKKVGKMHYAGPFFSSPCIRFSYLEQYLWNHLEQGAGCTAQKQTWLTIPKVKIVQPPTWAASNFSPHHVEIQPFTEGLNSID